LLICIIRIKALGERFLSAFLYTDYTDFTEKSFKNLCFSVLSVKSVYLRNSLLIFIQPQSHHFIPCQNGEQKDIKCRAFEREGGGGERES